MATKVTIGDWTFQAAGFTIQEDSTPLASDDTTGSVGVISAALLDADDSLAPAMTAGMSAIQKFGYNVLVGLPITVDNTMWGSIRGTVTSASLGQDRLINLTATAILARINAYNVKAQPYNGTLGGLFRYLCGLAGVTGASVAVDAGLESRPVHAIGWVGELWFHLKQLCVAHNAEVALVDNVVTLRPVRAFYAAKGYTVNSNSDTPVPTLAQSVEVYHYKTAAITDQLVYPPGGYKAETEVFNVNAGETAEYTLELSASVTSIQAPVMQEEVAPSYVTSSVFTIVANDGLPVPPAMWVEKGGELSLSIEPNTTSLRLRLKGAEGVPTTQGEAATNFSVALGSDTTGNRYSTLRIVGTGVSFQKEKRTFRTLVPESETATDVGVTIDNIYLNDLNQVYRAGTQAAADYSGAQPALSATVLGIRHNPTGPGTTPPAAIGHVGGARIWDADTNRFYRVRSASIAPDGISVNAEDDLTYGDMTEAYNKTTYGQVQARVDPYNLSYRQDAMTGVKNA